MQLKFCVGIVNCAAAMYVIYLFTERCQGLKMQQCTQIVRIPQTDLRD